MKMTLKRFNCLVSAYGTEVPRWPEAERNQALELLKNDPEAARIFQEASALDAALAGIPRPDRADEAFLKRLATIPFASRSLGEGAPTTFGEFMKGFFPARTFVPQGLGIAAMGILGIWLGFTAATKEPGEIVQLNPAQYFFDNLDLDKDLEDLR